MGKLSRETPPPPEGEPMGASEHEEDVLLFATCLHYITTDNRQATGHPTHLNNPPNLHHSHICIKAKTVQSGLYFLA